MRNSQFPGFQHFVRQLMTRQEAPFILFFLLGLSAVLIKFYLDYFSESSETSSTTDLALIPIPRCKIETSTTLSALIANLKINYNKELIDTHYPKHIAEKWHHLIQEQINKIRNILGCTHNSQSLAAILRDPEFTIEFVDSNSLQAMARTNEPPTGAYNALTKTVYLLIDTDLDEKSLATTLSNELISAAIHLANAKKPALSGILNPSSNPGLFSQPFLPKKMTQPGFDQQGNLSSTIIKKHQAALQEIFDNIKLFQKLKKQKFSELTPSQRQQLNQFQQALQEYVPISYRIELPEVVFSRLIENPQPPMIKENLFYLDSKQPTKAAKIEKIIDSKHDIILFYTFAVQPGLAGKIAAFEEDVTRVTELDTNYLQSNAAKAKDRETQTIFSNHLTSEAMSFWDEASTSVKKAFSPKFCEFYSEYLEVDNYCDRPSLKQ